MVETDEITTIDQFRLSLPIRLLNRVGAGLESLGIRTGRIDAAALISEACRQTKLENWGDGQFLEDYKVLIGAFERNTALSLLGRLAIRQELLRSLINRLRHVELIKQHPEILDVPIQHPLFILGLPRTGTTLLHKLFAQDDHMRVPPFWQLLSPFPLVDDDEEIQGRIRLAERTTRLSNIVAPLFRVIHRIDAHEPEECVFLLPHHLVYHGRGDVPEYLEWFLGRSALADYQYYKQELQILQWQQSVQHWVMKTPFHLFKLDALLEVFPDAGIVQTQRDPAKVIPSWCSFEAAIGVMHRNQTNREQIGRDWLSLWKTAIERAMTVRATHDEAQFFDLHYVEFLADPVGMIRRIYQHFGYPFSETAEAGMRRWFAEQTRQKHGVHRYDAAQFGLSEAGIRDEFKQYVERFNIRLET